MANDPQVLKARILPRWVASSGAQSLAMAAAGGHKNHRQASLDDATRELGLIA